MLSFYVLTDLHYYSPKSGTSGKAFEIFDSTHQVLTAQSPEVLQSCFDKICADNRSDVVLISGDITSNGEIFAHEEIIPMLRSLKQKGKKVYLITATHDYRGEGYTTAFDGDTSYHTPAATRDMLFDMYREFGPDDALDVHRESMSYVLELDESHLLFALNDDSNLSGKSGFSDDCFEWIAAWAEKAKAEGKKIIAMTHHPLIAPSPVYELIAKGDMLGDFDKRLPQLADLGVSFIFTGHTHIHNISAFKSEKGSVIYDVACASPIGAPGVFRYVEVGDDEITVSTEFVPTPSGFDRPLSEVLEDRLVGLIRRALKAGKDDIDELANLAQGMSIKPKIVYRFAWIIKPLFRLLDKITVGTVAGWVKKESGVKKKALGAEKDKKAADVALELFLNLYCGRSPYPPETSVFKVTMGLAGVIDSVLGFLHIDTHKLLKVVPDIGSLLRPLLFNSGIDSYEAVLKTSDPFDASDPNNEITVDRSFKSKKGPPLVIAAAILIILLLPVILPVTLCAVLVNRIKYHGKLK